MENKNLTGSSRSRHLACFPPQYTEFHENDVIEGSVRILDCRDGGPGRIYFGFCKDRRIPVVIKTIRKSLWEKYHLAEKWPNLKDDLTDDRLPSRSIDFGEYLFFTFFREARLVCQSHHHPNVVKGTRFWWTNAGQPFFECEYVENSRNLRDFLHHTKHTPGPGRVSILEATHIGISFCNGMIYINDRMLEQYNQNHPDNPALVFVHRDIRPENILINQYNNMTIIDMGLAKFHLLKSASSFAGFPLVAGAPYYMSPEQVRNFDAVLPASDVYSFGVTLLELLGVDCSVRYSSSELQEEIGDRRHIPTAFREILSRCVEESPAQRYRDFRELKNALAMFTREVKEGRILLDEFLRCRYCGYVLPGEPIHLPLPVHCPLCCGEGIPFTPAELTIPGKNIYTWIGFFDTP